MTKNDLAKKLASETCPGCGNKKIKCKATAACFTSVGLLPPGQVSRKTAQEAVGKRVQLVHGGQQGKVIGVPAQTGERGFTVKLDDGSIQIIPVANLEFIGSKDQARKTAQPEITRLTHCRAANCKQNYEGLGLFCGTASIEVGQDGRCILFEV